MANPITFNVQRLIAEVAAQHGLFLKPDDAAFALVTMNRLVLEESLEAIRGRVAEDSHNSRQARSGLTSAPNRLSRRRSVVRRRPCVMRSREISIPLV